MCPGRHSRTEPRQHRLVGPSSSAPRLLCCLPSPSLTPPWLGMTAKLPGRQLGLHISMLFKTRKPPHHKILPPCPRSCPLCLPPTQPVGTALLHHVFPQQSRARPHCRDPPTRCHCACCPGPPSGDGSPPGYQCPPPPPPNKKRLINCLCGEHQGMASQAAPPPCSWLHGHRGSHQLHVEARD